MHISNKLSNQFVVLRFLVVALVGGVVFTGCSREAYRRLADQEAYGLLRSRQTDQRWHLPQRTVEPDQRSRLANINSQDCGPLPPDDPAAECYMRNPFNSNKRVQYWDELGKSDSVDGRQWLAHLPYNEEGEIFLDKQLAVDLALLHSREFQTQVESLHVRALDLSANRFDYQLNWFGGSDLGFDATQDGFDAARDVGNNNRIGFNRSLATGGQFAANLANSFAWNFGGGGSSNFGAGNLVFSLTQPLLRGAFRHVRTESLTQSERSLLYEVRGFARFRRQFYLDVVAQYLNLLNQAQGLRIERENLKNLERSLEEHEVLYENGRVSPIQVDQIFQRYQSGRLSIINAEQGLQSTLDSYKFQLGLPARIPIKINEEILDPFQLNSPAVEKLQEDVDSLKKSLAQFLPPEEASEEFLAQSTTQLIALSKEVEQLKKTVDQEFQQWQDKLESKRAAEDLTDDEKTDLRQEDSLSKRIKQDLGDLDEQIKKSRKRITKLEGRIDSADEPNAPEEDSESETSDLEDDSLELDAAPVVEGDTEIVKQWREILFEISKIGGLKEQISTLFVAQTQIRLFLIEVKPLKIEEGTAIELALANRLDLMNSRATVVDAFRRVEIAADQLESDLSVRASADLRSDPTVDNAFRFDGDENQYSLGLEFDGPLNRLNERNSYRVAQIGYQQQRRAFMASEDAIVNGIRSNLRQLQANRANFTIVRRQLITASRLVEQAQFNLRTAITGDSSLTQDVLQALESLRNTKNGLISSWIRYEISRISLFVDLELLLLDERGVWVNEQEKFDQYNSSGQPEVEDTTIGESDSTLSGPVEPIDRPEFESDSGIPAADSGA